MDFALQNYDDERARRLEELGFKVIRFENKLIFESLEDVLEEISSYFKE